MALNTPPYSGNVIYRRGDAATHGDLRSLPPAALPEDAGLADANATLEFRRHPVVLAAILIPLLIALAGFVMKRPALQAPPAPPKEQVVRGRILAADGTILSEGASLNRNYPHGSLAGPLIGFTGAVQPDGRYGLEGLEYRADSVLQSGADIHLTLDPVLQSAAERQLALSAQANGAESGAAVVLEVGTGRILASASYPSYDPGEWQSASREQMINRPFQQVYEPGSVIKPLVVAALLEEGRLAPGELIDSPMTLRVGLKTFRDVAWHEPALTVPEILAYSSNSGMIRLGERLEPAELHGWLSRFGIGSDLDVAGAFARTGLLNPWEKWVPQDQAANVLGQNLSLTPLQLAAAYSIFANGGVFVPPVLIEGQEPREAHRVLSEGVARRVREMLGYVMENSGLRNSVIPGMSVAGKTGTADVYDPVTGSYPLDDYAITFTGMFPADAPKVVMAVMLMKPDPASTSTYVAAPLFRAIGSEAVAHIGARALNGADGEAGAGASELRLALGESR